MTSYFFRDQLNTFLIINMIFLAIFDSRALLVGCSSVLFICSCNWKLYIFVGDDSQSNDSTWSMECAHALRVKSIYISSAILAAKSPFFYKVRTKKRPHSTFYRIYAVLFFSFLDCNDYAAFLHIFGS